MATIDLPVEVPAPTAPAPDRGRWIPRVNAATAAVVLLAFAALIWHRRWIADDGLIVLRTVRQLLAGNGPVFNVGERVEANTSTLWTYLLALPGLVPGVSLNWAAVVAGLLCSVAGVGLGMDAARRLFGGRRLLLPLGALVVVALPAYWDFGTSGLETGLVLGWLGLAWWLLVRRLVAHRDGDGGGRTWPAAVVLGLAPLVRPDLALFGLVGIVALAVVERRRGVALLGPAAAALALPLAYEVFRAGYYGLLVPGTALAKEAGEQHWEQGGYYLDDVVGTYRLGWPLALAGAGMALLLWRFRRAARPSLVLVAAAPVVAGLLLGLYVIRVGGDFMHARMLLPALFCLLLPVMAVPASRWTLVPVLGTAVWAGVCASSLRPAYDTLGPHWIANERMYYVKIVNRPHPVVAEDFVEHPIAPEGVAALAAAPGPTLALAGPRADWYLLSAAGSGKTIVWLNIGVAGALAPLDTRVLDPVGLANPLAAHTYGKPDGRIGHDKSLPPDWYAAVYGAQQYGFLSPRKVSAARAAVACAGTTELLDSYRAPLTPARFWANLTSAYARTSYRFPADPFVAALCR